MAVGEAAERDAALIICAIIQARMGSTRLPGKVMKDLAGDPMLARVLNRVGRAKLLDRVTVATTTRPEDDIIRDLCARRDVPCYSGSEIDVLDRYYRAAAEDQADVVVRITSDCPLIEPYIIDKLITAFINADPPCDYMSNSMSPRTFPRGLDVEVFSFEALARAHVEDVDPTTREHVTPYMYFNPALFRCKPLHHDTDLSFMRWTVDTQEDLRFVRLIYAHFGHDRFSWWDVLALLDVHPEWQAINQHIVQKTVR